MRAALMAFVGSAIFLAGVLVGVGGSDEADGEVPVAIALVDEASARQPPAKEQGSSRSQGVEREVKHGEADDHGGNGEAEYEYEYEHEDDDSSGPGSDDSGSGSDDSGSGSDNSGPGSDDSGSGSDNSGSGSDSSGSGSSGSGDGGGDD
jgi:hypothetical protein